MKRLLCAILLLIFVFTLASCYGDRPLPVDPVPGQDPDPGEEPSRDYLALVRRSPAAAKEFSYNEWAAVRSKVNDALLPYSAEFISAFLQQESPKHENTVCSPITAYFALCLAAECARGATQQEILSALHVSNLAELRDCADTFYSASTSERIVEGQTISKERVTNSLWFDPDYTFDGSTLNSLAQFHHAFAVAASFGKRNAESNKAVNDFIYAESNKLLKPNLQFDENTVCLLISTLYVRDLWNLYCDLPMTAETYNFVNYDGSTTATKLVDAYHTDGKPLETSQYSAFPVTSSYGYKLYFVVPKNGQDIAEIMKGNTISDVLTAKYETMNADHTVQYETEVLFPEFTVENKVSICQILQSLGISTVFSDKADLTGLLPENQAFFSDVVQANKLRVDKKGFEGASVTVIEVAGTAAPMETEYFTLTVDRSFGFVLANPFGIPLFSGIVFNK